MKRLFTLAMFLLLTGCSSFLAPPTPNPEETTSVQPGTQLGNHYMAWPARQAQLNTVTSWTAQGSVAARTDKKGWNAYYHWQQQGNIYDLSLFGPLGVNRVQLDGRPGLATLTNAAQQKFTAPSAEILLQQRLGWALPVSNLYYWLRGLPAPHTRFRRSFDMNNHLVNLYQNGWRIIYLRYVAINGIDVPDRLLLTSGPWQVRLAVTKWQF